jgi:two-component system cell cycle sensor histidine kinase/response regulator CckA
MPTGGRLALAVKNVHLERRETSAWPWVRPGRCVRVTVTDTGVGMTPETAARIFEPFFTTKPAGKGTGLGLSVVQGILHQHGGFINVSSELNKGTTFSLYVPSYPRPEYVVDTAPPPLQEAIIPDQSGTLVLLAEDDANVRNVAQAILRRNGYRVLAATDGEEACRLAEAHTEEIAVAVLDVVMPRKGGIDAARRIQEICPSLPIILCTGYAGGIALPEFSTGGWRLLTKPYTNQELITYVQKALGAVASTPRA